MNRETGIGILPETMIVGLEPFISVRRQRGNDETAEITRVSFHPDDVCLENMRFETKTGEERDCSAFLWGKRNGGWRAKNSLMLQCLECKKRVLCQKAEEMKLGEGNRAKIALETPITEKWCEGFGDGGTVTIVEVLVMPDDQGVLSLFFKYREEFKNIGFLGWAGKNQAQKRLELENMGFTIVIMAAMGRR